MKTKIISTVAALLLAACGTTEVAKNPDGTYNVSAQYGSLNGSWGRASKEAAEAAANYCNSIGQKYYFLNEQRTGVVGWSPQESAITFNCGPDTAATAKKLAEQCKAEMNDPSLDSIKDKVQLYRTLDAPPPPFELATNNKYPTQAEKVAIAKWAKMRESCVSREINASEQTPKSGNALQDAFAEKSKSYAQQINAQVGALIVALYQSKVTYGEFAQKRYEMVAAIVNAQQDYKAALLQQDRDLQMKAEQVALQKQQNNILAWSTYMQSVNARQPQAQVQTIQPLPTNRNSINCTTNRIGNTINTNCN